MVRNRACVPNWHKRKFSQDMLNRDDIQDWFLMVKLVYNLGSNRLQPSCRNEIMNIIYIIRIKCFISIIHIIQGLGPQFRQAMHDGWLKYIKATYAAQPGEEATGPSIGQGRVVVEDD